MIKLGKESSFYRPYYYGKYVIKNIKFYDENGIIIESNNGWLENERKDLEYIYLNIDEIPTKRKEDFKIKNAFIISKGKNYSNELECDLYINVSLVNLHFTEYKKEFDSIRKYYVGTDSSNQNFEISENVKWLKDDLCTYKRLIEENAKKLTFIYDNTSLDDIKKCIKNIQKYAKKMFEEKQRIEDYMVEDYIKEMESKGV